MRFSWWQSASRPWDDLVELSQHAERTGWDGIWVADHFMTGRGDQAPVGEAWSILAALAALVPRVRLGPLVTGNTYRHPPVLAKQAAQVDVISGGRLVFGIGAAWQQNEHEAYGIPFYTPGERLRRLAESVQIIKGLFTSETTTFEGRYYTVRDAVLSPKPVQQPHPPVLIGGGGEKVTLRIAAQHADEWNVWGLPEVLRHKGGVLDQHCERLGRDPATIKRSANVLLTLSDDPDRVRTARERGGPRMLAGNVEELRDTLGQYVDAGVDELIIADFTMAPVEQTKETHDRFIEEVAKGFR